MSDEEKLKALEDSNADQEVSERFKSPAGDTAIDFLDKEFSKIEAWLEIKLGNSRYKSLILTQLEFAYAVIRTFVLKALT